MKFLPWLLLVYFIIFPFGQLGRIEIGSGVNIHLVDFMAGVIAFLWLITNMAVGKWNFPKLTRPLISFWVVAAFSLLLGSPFVSNSQLLVGSLYLFRLLIYIFLYFAIWDFVRKYKWFKGKVLSALLSVGAFIAIFGWVQYLVLPDTRALFELGWDDHYFRLVGTFLDPGFTGILIVFFTIFVFTKIWGRAGEWGNWFLLVFGLSALALTYSRASFLALGVGVITLYIVRRKLMHLIWGIGLLVLAIFLLPRPGGEGTLLERTSTVYQRLENYKQTFEIGMARPLFGTGFNLYRYSRGDLEDDIVHSGAGADSSLLFVFATTGIAGLSAYLWLWWRIIRIGLERRRTQAGVLLLSSSAALLLHSVFANSLFYPWVLGWMAVLLGLQED